MKIGRNDPCPCGSGKKHKKCCMDKTNSESAKGHVVADEKKGNSFFSKYNTIDLLKSFAGLSLLPENHGKYVRMEELARTCMLNYNNDKNVPTTQILREFLNEEYPSHYLEDPPTNLFTDLVTFYGGDYLIFPGITESGSFILTNLLAAVFQWPDSGIPKEFINNCFHKVSLILAVSNAIALRLDNKRYQEGAESDQEIVVPNDILFSNLKAAVIFTSEEISLLCKKHAVDRHAINEFLLDINSPDLNAPHVEESPLVYKPILYIEGKYIVVSPTTLSLAITDYIWALAEKSGCMKEVNEAYHSMLWNNLQLQLGQMKFRRIEVQEVTVNIVNHEKEGLYRFDDDKIAYVQYLGDQGLNYRIETEAPGDDLSEPQDLERHKQEVISQILARPEFAAYEILNLTILSSIGRDFIHFLDSTENARSMAISVFEMDVMWNLKDSEALDLWKFSIARDEQVPNGMVMAFSFLDQFKMYKDHQDSFYLSDETRFNTVHVQVGYADDFVKLAKHNTDKHSALKFINGKIANVQVEKKDKYAPVYVDLMGLVSSELEFLVGGFYQAIWVKPLLDSRKNKGGLRHIFWQITDALAYWLWQIQEDIKGDLAPLGIKPLTFSFDLIPIEKFETIDRDFKRDPDLSSKFQTRASDSGVTLLIPAEILPYLYGADNEGERVLVTHMLLGINKLLELNAQDSIPDDRILQIIESNVPLGMKKKVFLLDSSDNLLLDPTNLNGYRCVQEYDTSIVLNSIVPALGVLCPPVGEITTHGDRDDLSFKIVHNALLAILRDKISKYNSTALLKRLISQNESLIRKREELRVHTPTRIACFVGIEQQQIDLQENLAALNRTTIAIRCLIEHIAAEPKKGAEIISITALDELVAIMDQVFTWGSLSDQIHFKLFDVKLSILPSGRIGTSKDHIKEVFDPYNESKTKETITDSISTFDQVFPQNEEFVGKATPENLNEAFIADYGVSFTRICEFVGVISQIGFLQSTSYASFPLVNLREAVNKYVDDFNETEFQSAVSYLSLSNRGGVDILPSGYDFIDVMPWRFNRMLSNLRKPLILVDSEMPGGSKTVYWGARQVLASRIYLAEQCQTDRLRVFKNSEVKKVLGKFAKERGDALVKKIKRAINLTGLIVDQDVYIGPNHSLKNDIDIGDVDILVIDEKNKTLFSLECKSMSQSRNIKEMVDEVEKLFGSKSEMGWIDKHLRRHGWLENNRSQISAKYKIDISDFKIKSIFITNEDMLTPYLRKQTLPMPIITSYEVESGGYNSLLKIQ